MPHKYTCSAIQCTHHACPTQASCTLQAPNSAKLFFRPQVCYHATFLESGDCDKFIYIQHIAHEHHMHVPCMLKAFFFKFRSSVYPFPRVVGSICLYTIQYTWPCMHRALSKHPTSIFRCFILTQCMLPLYSLDIL